MHADCPLNCYFTSLEREGEREIEYFLKEGRKGGREGGKFFPSREEMLQKTYLLFIFSDTVHYTKILLAPLNLTKPSVMLKMD